MRKSVLAGAIAFSLLSLNVHALSVGKMNIESYLGEPLDISIDVKSISNSELSTLDVSLASRELFTRAGISYPEHAKDLRVELDSSKEGDAKILVTSTNAVSDPFVHLLLQISWSGGNMLREYTALIDPSGYKVQPIVRATAPAAKLGVVKVAAETGNASEAKYHPAVKNGDSLSAIAALYRPADVSIQQAWIAFYNLNREAFPDNNLNKITKGVRLRIPTETQMKAMPQSTAISEVKKLTRPISADPAPAVAQAKAEPVKVEPAKAAEPIAPTLVVGGAAEAPAAEKQVAPAVAPAPAPTTVLAAQDIALSDLKGYDQFASVVTEMGKFTQTIREEMDGTREQNKLFKDELLATRGENRVLSDRMATLETQLEKMNQLLEMQSQALQAMNQNTIARSQQDSAAVQLEAVDVQPAVAETDIRPVAAEPASSEPVVEKDKTYYEQLLEGAITDASEADRSYIDDIVEQSSTAIGMPDTNPVTPEMQIAATKPDAPSMPADQETALMLENVRASLGNLQATGGADAVVQTGAINVPDIADIDLNIADKDIAYIEALNEDDRGEIQKSEQRIAALELELQEKIKAAQATQTAQTSQVDVTQQAAQAVVPQADTDPAQVKAVESSAPPPAARVAPVDTGIMSTLMGSVDSVKSSMSGVSSEIWKLMGGVGIGILGLMVILGLRSRREEESDESDILLDNVNDMSTSGGSTSEAELDDLSDFAARNTPEADADMDFELHGSSMFDLSDESFMASEAIQDDSSLFSMDDDNSDMDSLGEMDSNLMGNQQSTLTAVDVDPIAEAEVYLAYDRKEQAIEVLEQSLKQNSDQAAVVTKLLSLYQDTENREKFSELFESSAGSIEDEDEWDKIKRMAKEFVPEHELLEDDFDSSIPVLMDELVDTAADDSEDIAGIGDDLLAVAAANLDNLDSQKKIEIEEDQDIEETGLSLSLSDEPLGLAEGPAEDSDSVKLEEELDSAMEEVNQHDPETALALAKAYIELGENDIAKDFLNDVINADGGEMKKDAEKILASMA